MSDFSFDLSGRTAMVTGASSGLGERFAKILAGSGANVVLAARREELLQNVTQEIEAAGGKAIAVAMDATDPASIKAGFNAAEAAFGPVNTLVANAGISEPSPTKTLDIDSFDRTIAINLRGAFLSVQEAGRRMMDAGSHEKENGRIVIVSSILATKTMPYIASYAASKAGVLQMGKVIALEWARRGINVNMICPGYIRTALNDEWFESDDGKKQIATWPRRRLIDQAALDVPLLYLCSNASRHVTGTSITVDDAQAL